MSNEIRPEACGYFTNDDTPCARRVRIRLERELDADRITVCAGHAADLLADQKDVWNAVGVVHYQ